MASFFVANVRCNLLVFKLAYNILPKLGRMTLLTGRLEDECVKRRDNGRTVSHMGIDCGDPDAGVAGQALDEGNAGAVFEQVRGVGVIQHMQRHSGIVFLRLRNVYRW